MGIWNYDDINLLFVIWEGIFGMIECSVILNWCNCDGVVCLLEIWYMS